MCLHEPCAIAKVQCTCLLVGFHLSKFFVLFCFVFRMGRGGGGEEGV